MRGLIAYPVGSAIPVRADSRKLPRPLSIAFIVLAVGIFAFRVRALRIAADG